VTNEAKTGILVLVCLAALGALVLKVGNFKFFQEGYIIKSKLHYSAGVKKHAPVRLSGVDVGEVKDIQILYGDETVVELILWLREGVKVRLDSKAYVATLGLMGEKYVEIKAGSSAAEFAKPGDLIPGQDPVRLEELMEMATKIAGDIGQMAKDISKVANHVDTAITDNKPKLDRIFDNLESTAVNFNDFSQNIKYHPWKVLAKGKEKSKEEMDREDAQHKVERQKQNAR
jgi:phospholipid/cholesterol/gamma-HCH transport system substrate-binding protein